MATATTVARPTQALRQRRVSERPGIARVNTRATTADTADSTAPPLARPYVVDQAYILKKFNGKPPSLVVQLHPNHFKFLQQDGTFPYNSPMRTFLQHLKEKTLPHEMLEELYATDVPFYDGCLIVEVQDFRSGQKKANTTNNVGGTDGSPFSVHNWNEHITPSPFVSFPDKIQTGPGAVKREPTDAVPTDRVTDKENMPAPDQPASASQKKVKPAATYTVVLFPTSLSAQEDISILARTPLADARTTQRILQANGRDGATPTLPHPPTPLTSVPATPVLGKSTPKKPKMVLDETNVHDFEAEVLLKTNPVLYLEPARDGYESDAIVAMLAHPLHSEKPLAPKTRKRTIAEVAADQAHAAEEERYMLSYDERHQSTTGHAGAAEGQTAATSLEQPFKRFKTLETIKSRHSELEREKKENATREAYLKRQQTEADNQKRREQEEQTRLMQIQSQKQMADHQKQAQFAQAQARAQANQAQAAQAQAAQQHAAQIQQQQTPVTSHSQQMLPTPTQHLQVSQPPAMSPVVRQGTPYSASSPMMRGADASTMGMTSVPMAATASSQGAGSPPRPASAVSHHPGAIGMARQMSHQNAQIGSAHGTPQLTSTPHMSSAQPARMMTPAPRVTQQGSPAPGAMQATPMMASASFNGLTPEQVQHRRMVQMTQQQLSQGQQNAGGPMPPQNMQQLIMLQKQQQAAQMGMVNPGHQPPQMQNAQHAALQRSLQMQQAQQRNAQNMQHHGQNMNMIAVQNQMGVNTQDSDPNSSRAVALRWRQQQINAMKHMFTTKKNQFLQRQPSQQEIAQYDAQQTQEMQAVGQRINQQTQARMQEEEAKRQAFQQRQNAAMQQQIMGQHGNPATAQQGNSMGQMGPQVDPAYIAQMQKYRQIQLHQLKQQQMAQLQQQGMGQTQGMPNMQNLSVPQQQQLLRQMQMNNMNMGAMNMQGMGGGMNGMPGQMGPNQGMGI